MGPPAAISPMIGRTCVSLGIDWGTSSGRQAQHQRRRGRQADGPRLGRPALQVALLLEDLEVVVHRRRGREADRLARSRARTGDSRARGSSLRSRP